MYLNVLSLGMNVTFTGMFIVFMMLVFLVVILSVFGSVSQLGSKKENKAPAVTVKPEQKKPTHKVIEKKVTQEQITPEIIAVISAAVASMYTGSSKKPVIKAVKRSSADRSAWATAGIYNNTRAF